MKNHFEIFSLPVAFEIDLEALEKKYLEFQKQFHPDKSSTADITKSIAVNEAYDVLQNSISRATHILQLQDIDLENDSTAPKPDLATLQEILELQEKITEIEISEIQNLRQELNKKITSLLEEVAANLTKQDFKTAAQILIKVKYFDKTLSILKAKKNK